MARLIIQCDWDSVLREHGASAWVTYKNKGLPSVHGEVTCVGMSSEEGQPYIEASDGFTVTNISKKRIGLSYDGGDSRHCRCSFQAPVVTYSVHKQMKKVVCLDATPGGLAVSCDTEGMLKVWLTSNGEVRRILEGHYGDVYTCRFFPSGIVILSGGADTQLKIWSAETGQCAATMTGHRAGISDTAVVDRGRNVVSCSRDGTAKLWDCGQSKCLDTVAQCGGEVNGCALAPVDSSVDLGAPDKTPGEREVMTDGKLLLLACENGTLQGYGLQSRKKVFETRCSDAVNCCAFLSSQQVVCGTQDSSIYIYDIRNTGSPLRVFVESRGPVHSVLPHKQGFFASTGDGSCFYVNEELQTSLELTGPDCDSVYKIVSDGTCVYTASRDSHIRRYQL